MRIGLRIVALARLNDVSRDPGLGDITAVDPRNAGGADISFVAEAVEMAIDALGLKGKADRLLFRLTN